MTVETSFSVGGYPLAADRHYDRETHLWVESAGANRVRIGFDPLGAETSGDIVAVSFEPVGSRVERGGAFGSLEAAKFVGPLLAPLSGTVMAHNEAVIAAPGKLNLEPMEHWLVELEVAAGDAEMTELIHGEESVRQWFESDLERFRIQGMIAE
jgi:glycine cleavage system H protein